MSEDGVKIPDNLPDPDWGALGEVVFSRSYSRVKEDGAKENWAECVKRFVDGNCNYVDGRYIEPYEKQRLFWLVYNMEFIPAGRHLWATGIGKGSEFVSNCFTAGFDPDNFHRHFTYSFLRLMEGGGVGCSYSNSYVRCYDPIPKEIDLHLVCSSDHDDYEAMEEVLSDSYSHEWAGCFEIDDSREGWAEGLGKLLKAYYNGSSQVVIDLSYIRSSGTPLKTFGGTASGPAALAKMLDKVNRILNDHKGLVPNSELFLNIDHEIAKAVIAGGTRRSARMSSKYWKDGDIFEFMKMKTDGKSHWTSNFSVEVDTSFWDAVHSGDDRALRILDEIVYGMITNGEPGLINMTKLGEGEINPPYCTNPCLSGETEFVNSEGKKQKLSDNHQIEVWDGGNWKNAEVLYRGLRKTIKLTFVGESSGGSAEMVVTPDHPFTVDGEKVLAADLEGKYPDMLPMSSVGCSENSLHGSIKVESVEDNGYKDVYDFRLEGDVHHASWNGVKILNCGEIPATISPDTNLKGLMACNLGSLNLDKLAKDPAKTKQAIRYGSRALIRATYADYPDEELREVVNKERRIGLGIMGFHPFLLKHGCKYTDFPHSDRMKDKFRDFYESVTKAVQAYASHLRIPVSIKCTTVAPTGCVKEGTSISTEYGIKRIEDLRDTKSSDRWQPAKSEYCATDTSYELPSKHFYNGYSDVVEVKTKAGFSLSATPDHKIRVITSEGDYRWKQMDALDREDNVVLRGSTLSKSFKDVALHSDEHCNNHHNRNKNLKLPYAMTPKLAEFIGYFVGNGYVHDGVGVKLIVGSRFDDCIEYLKNLGKEVFGVDPTIEDKVSAISLCFGGTILPRYFHDLGWSKDKGNHGEGAASATVPDEVLNSGSDIVKSFLKGLFSADGSVDSRGKVSYSSVSEKLVKQVQLLLLSLGIKFTKSTTSADSDGHWGNRSIHYLRGINKYQDSTFLNEIGFIEKDSNINIEVDKLSHSKDVLPGCVVKHLKGSSKYYEASEDLRKLLHNAIYGQNITRPNAERLSEYLSNDIIDMFVNNDLFIDSIDSITESKVNTYDLEMPDNHTYVANGFVTHNSTSKLPGTTPGMQPMKYKYFIHRVRFTLVDSEKAEKVEHYRKLGFNVIDNVPREDDVAIVEFPLAAPDLSEVEADLVETSSEISIEQMLSVQETLQDVWADNSISVTIDFDADEVSEDRIKRALISHVPNLKGVTLFPEVSNMQYPPMEEITKEEFMEYPEHLRQESNAAGECVTGSCEFDPSKIKGE